MSVIKTDPASVPLLSWRISQTLKKTDGIKSVFFVSNQNVLPWKGLLSHEIQQAVQCVCLQATVTTNKWRGITGVWEAQKKKIKSDLVV